MSFQAYLDAIELKSGKTIAELRAEAESRGLTGAALKATDVLNWLGDSYGLGKGHAMAFFGLLKAEVAPRLTTDEAIDKLFGGPKAHWRPAFDDLYTKLQGFGRGVTLATTDSYISLLRDGAKFGVVAVTGDRLDIGIKRKGIAPTDRFTAAGTWNSMVTHRVQITDPAQIDSQVLDWLRAAYTSTSARG